MVIGHVINIVTYRFMVIGSMGGDVGHIAQLELLVQSVTIITSPIFYDKKFERAHLNLNSRHNKI